MIFPFTKEPLKNRLDKSDAKYVQCIHTAYASFGTSSDCGYADFYVNNGRTQPTCTKGNIVCYHAMSHEYFSEAMLIDHIFEGPHCNEGKLEHAVKQSRWLKPLLFVVDYLRDEDDCDQSRTDRLGIHTNEEDGRFFVETNLKYPYAKRLS